MIPPVVRSAEEWGEVPGAAIRVQREGGRLPAGYTRVLSRVIVEGWWGRGTGPSGLRGYEPDGMYRDILLISR